MPRFRSQAARPSAARSACATVCRIPCACHGIPDSRRASAPRPAAGGDPRDGRSDAALRRRRTGRSGAGRQATASPPNPACRRRGARAENIAWRAPLAGLGTSSPIVWGDRVFVTSQIGARRWPAGARIRSWPRDDRALAERETPIGGRRPAGPTPADDVWLVVEAFGRIRRPPAVGAPHARRPDRCPSCTRSTTWPRRRRSPTASASTPGSATARSSRSTWTGASSGRAISGTEYAPFDDAVGARQLTGALRRSPDPAVRPPVRRRTCWRSTRAPGKERWKVDRGDGPRLAQHAARRPGPERRRAARQLVASASTPTIPSTGKLLWYHRQPSGRRRFRRPSSTTAASI